MTVLFGHPTGNPNSLQAALAHYEAGHLEAFCVPWMPSAAALRTFAMVPGMGGLAKRLSRRRFEPLKDAPMVQGRFAEWIRLALRASGLASEGIAYGANDWLMQTMKRECRRPEVTAVHCYEDCSSWQFAEARKIGKACIYDMPIGYYPEWQQTQDFLARRYARWIPSGGLPSSRFVRPLQKQREMELADLVLAPSTFVERTIAKHHPNKIVMPARYGVDLEFWRGPKQRGGSRTLRFLYTGQISLRKGMPVLLEAWRAAAIPEAELHLVGLWQLADSLKHELPPGIAISPPCSSSELRDHYRNADVFVFPSFFEGFGLVLLEAMACGMPAIASTATAGPDVLDDSCGRIVRAGDVDELIAVLEWFGNNRSAIERMGIAARARAATFTWARYRDEVRAAVAKHV